MSIDLNSCGASFLAPFECLWVIFLVGEIMKKVCWMFFGVANVALGTNLDFRVDQGSFGMIRICECNTQKSRELSLNDSVNFQGFTFCNFEQELSLKQNDVMNRLGLVKIRSGKPLLVKDIVADSCEFFSPLLILFGQCEITELTAQKNISLKNESSLISSKINFQPNGWDLCCFYIENSAELGRGNLQINGDRVTIKNLGLIEVDKLELNNFGRESSIDFLQYGSLIANSVIQKGRLFQNRGQTRVGEYNLVTSTTLEIEKGTFYVDLLKGNICALMSFGSSRSHFQRMEGHVERLRNRSAIVEAEEVDTDSPIDVNTREGGVTRLGQAHSVGTVIASNASFSAGRVHAREVSAHRASNIAVHNGEIESVNVNGQSEAELHNSAVKNVRNEHMLNTKNSSISHLLNNNLACFQERNFIDTMENFGHMQNSGILYTYRYTGSKGSILETKERLSEASESVNPPLKYSWPINLLSQNSATYLKSITGEGGEIKAPNQFYFGHMLKGFKLRGNVDVYLDYMPEETEVSEHEGGDFKLHLNLTESVVNESDKQYGDVIFYIDMNGFDWKNIRSTFNARGLEIQNAGVFENRDGFISLQDFMAVRAERILNTATPVESKGKTPSVHFHLMNRRTGILTGEGGTSFKATDSVINEFSSIGSRGPVNIEAETIQNIVGEIHALKKSSMKGKRIDNISEMPSLRLGEFHQKCKNNNKIWRYDLYLAELVNRSEGAKMIFGEGVDIKGDEIHVIGSKIIGNDINIDCNIQDFLSVLGNIAEVGGRVYLNGSKIRGIAMRMWSIENDGEE